MNRDYDLIARLAGLPDELWISPQEVAELTGLATATIQQRRVVGLPPPGQRRPTVAVAAGRHQKMARGILSSRGELTVPEGYGAATAIGWGQECRAG